MVGRYNMKQYYRENEQWEQTQQRWSWSTFLWQERIGKRRSTWHRGKQKQRIPAGGEARPGWRKGSCKTLKNSIPSLSWSRLKCLGMLGRACPNRMTEEYTVHRGKEDNGDGPVATPPAVSRYND